MKGTSRKIVGIGIVVLTLVLVGFVAACGDGNDAAPGLTDTPAAAPGLTDTPAATPGLEEAIDQIDAMLVAAESGDLEAAEAAFEAAHDPLHEVIESLETSDPDQAAALDEAVEDAENDFKEESDADHIVEIGQEIRDLLRQLE